MEPTEIDPAGEPAAKEPPAPKSVKELADQSIQKIQEKAATAPLTKDEKAVEKEIQKYVPNFKFRANDKEHEIPEFLRAAVKDEKAEKYLKTLFETSYGFNGIKDRYGKLKETHQQLDQGYKSVMGQVGEAAQAYKQDDLDTVFDIFRIAPEKVLQWAIKKVELSQLPPEQKQVHDARVAAERQAREYQKQNEAYTQEQMQQQGQYFTEMLEMVFERPDISAVAQAYDSRKGAGKFRDFVVKIGQAESANTGKILTPLQAAKQAMELLGDIAPPAQKAEPAQPGPASQAATAQKPVQQKQVIPNMANAGARPNSAPAKTKVKSIDDIRKAYDAMSGSNA